MWRHVRVGALMLMLAMAAASAQSPQAQPQTAPAESADCQRHGAICVSTAYEAVVSSGGIMTAPASNTRADPDAVRTLGAQIGFIVSDFLRSWNAAPANKICVGTRCTYYYKTCNANRCDYQYGYPVPGYPLYPGNMSISYTTQDTLQSAERNIFLALGPDGDKVFVPLSEIKTTTDGRRTLICAPGSTDPDC